MTVLNSSKTKESGVFLSFLMAFILSSFTLATSYPSRVAFFAASLNISSAKSF